MKSDPHALTIPMTDDERDAHEQWRRQDLDRKLQAIPERFRGGFGSLAGRHPEMSNSCTWASLWVDGLDLDRPEASLFISGPLGTGKTGIAYGLARLLIERGTGVLIWYVPDLLEAIKASWNDPSIQSEHEILDEATAAPVLVLDDLGSETATDWSIGTLALVVDRRYREERTIIATSNLSPGGLLGHMRNDNGRRIVSRLNEMCEELVLDGGDLRSVEPSAK